jgi:hypothetical protein
MEQVWIGLAEVGMEPGDMPSGDTVGFMWITLWAPSAESYSLRVETYLARHKWSLISMQDIKVSDRDSDRGDEVNRMIDETLRDRNTICLGTYYSYKPN